MEGCADEEEAAGERMLLERFLRWAWSGHAHFDPFVGGKDVDRFHLGHTFDGGEDFKRGARHSSRHLVMAVLFAWHLRDNVGIHDALPCVIDVILPGLLSYEHLNAVSFPHVASRSTVRSGQLRLDIAWMLSRRASNAVPAIRYGWADSSGTAKSDWLMSKTQPIPEAQVRNLFSASKEVIGCEDETKHGVFGKLLDAVRVCSNVPQALGMGYTKIEYKVAALAFAYFLEIGTMLALMIYLQSFVSFTSDMGTEMGTASFWYSDVRSLLPSWLQKPRMSSDIAGDEDDDMGGWDSSLRQFLPRAIIIPGALHIVSNLSTDIANKLEHWKTFLQQLLQFQELLSNRDRRDVFVNKCVGHNHAFAISSR